MIDDERTIGSLIASCAFELPESFIRFHRQYGAVEGELRIPPYWFQLWSARDLLQANRDYKVQVFLPGWFAFGSSGGGEMLAFYTREPQPWKVYVIPFLAMTEAEARAIAEEFESFVEAMITANDNFESKP